MIILPLLFDQSLSEMNLCWVLLCFVNCNVYEMLGLWCRVRSLVANWVWRLLWQSIQPGFPEILDQNELLTCFYPFLVSLFEGYISTPLTLMWTDPSTAHVILVVISLPGWKIMPVILIIVRCQLLRVVYVYNCTCLFLLHSNSPQTFHPPSLQPASCPVIAPRA